MEEVIHNLSLAMLTEGCEPYVFAPRVRGRNNKLEVPYKVLRYSRPSSRRFGLRQLLIPLLWYHGRYKFDILHCHGVYPPGYVGVSFQKITGVPVIITPHGGDIKTNGEGHVINRRITLRIKKTFSETRAVTAISSHVKEQVISLNANPDKVYLIPNGIWLNEFCHVSNKHTIHEDPYILYLGRLVAQKGVNILIQAFSRIITRHPNIRLKIAGEGRDKNNLIKLAISSGTNRNIDFLGIVRGPEKINLLSNALFLVLPSQREGFPVVVLEAFASGIPVVASFIGGTSDIIRNDENGFLISPEDIEGFADKLSCLLRDERLREQFSVKALATASSYDWSKVVRKYISVYESFN
jgi:glycosyltransferase involved in cell wall biosynthesis